MFVHGTRDGFGSIDEVVAALTLIRARPYCFPFLARGTNS
jgi:hypothetical protein